MSTAGILNGPAGPLVVRAVLMAYRSQYDTVIGHCLKDLVADALI